MTEFLSVDEAAARAGVSRRTLYRWIHEGAVPTIKRGRTVRIPGDALPAPKPTNHAPSDTMEAEGMSLDDLIAECELLYSRHRVPAAPGDYLAPATEAERARFFAFRDALNRRISRLADEAMRTLRSALEADEAHRLEAAHRAWHALPAVVRRWAFAAWDPEARASRVWNGDLEPLECLDAAVARRQREPRESALPRRAGPSRGRRTA